MATYTELVGFYGTSDFDALRNKIKVAITIKCKAIADVGSPTAAQKEYIQSAIANPQSSANTVVNYVLAANNGQSIANINAASDASIQTNVDSAIDELLTI